MDTLVIASVYKSTTISEFLTFWESLVVQSCQEFSLCLYVDGPISLELVSCITRCSQACSFRVKIIKSSANSGLATALNSMIMWGLGNNFSIFIRADSDDRFPSHRFQTLIKFLNQNPHIDAVGSNYSYFGIRKGRSRLSITEENIMHNFSYKVSIGHATVAFRRSFFSKAGFYEQGFINRIEDQRLWAAAFRNNCRIANVEQVLYEVRVTKALLFRRASLSEKTELLLIRLRHSFTQMYFYESCIFSLLALLVYFANVMLIVCVIPIKLYFFLFSAESDRLSS